MNRRASLPPELPPDFRVGDARHFGVSAQRLRASDLASPFRGVRTTGLAQTQLELCRAFAAARAPGQFFSHVSAAVLYGIPLPRPLEESQLVDVAVVAPAHPPQMRGVNGHRLQRATTTVRSGLPVSSPSETWIQLASVLDGEQLVVAGDYLVQRKRSLCRLDDLAGAIRPGAPGVRAARLALALVRRGTDSPMETRLRLALIRAGLPEPVIGHTIRDASGGFVGTPDLAYVAERIALEYEGSVHFTDPRVYADDIVRRELMEDAGWFVIRVIARDMGARLPGLIARVGYALRSRRRT